MEEYVHVNGFGRMPLPRGYLEANPGLTEVIVTPADNGLIVMTLDDFSQWQADIDRTTRYGHFKDKLDASSRRKIGRDGTILLPVPLWDFPVMRCDYDKATIRISPAPTTSPSR